MQYVKQNNFAKFSSAPAKKRSLLASMTPQPKMHRRVPSCIFYNIFDMCLTLGGLLLQGYALPSAVQFKSDTLTDRVMIALRA
jgi:hypothetical protein